MAQDRTPPPTPGLAFGERESRSLMGALLSLACFFAAVDACVSLGGVRYGPEVRQSPRAPGVDAREAIELAQQWRLAGDELPVIQRLRIRPGRRAWAAEATGPDAYLVICRLDDGSALYAFEVDLDSERVQTAPETVEQLTAMRVREESATHLALIASVR